MGKKIGVFISFLTVGLAVFFFGESMLLWIQSFGQQYLIVTALIATVLALFPIIPYPITGGLIGAAFGPITGSLITWIGSSSASILMFILIRYAYQDYGLSLINRFHTTSKITVLFEKSAFMTIFITRLIPIIPSILVNAYSALSRVKTSHYVFASSLGKVPSMILFATVGNAVLQDPATLFMIGIYYFIFLIIVYVGYRSWQRWTLKNKRSASLEK
ncbi:TVP38/TMEM64 family protein [Shouchella patagoniensis]|uniref:TVP38/TMEM64 family protein n=1 Tax=Shouchella patagoniensis TaxID=228576 RepID=UPI0009958C46|nr:TVP38/TMEM64 family protein [Shouchella patagoniensis]